MGAVLAKMIFKTGRDPLPVSEAKSLFELPATDIDGNQIEHLGTILEGKKAILVINVASK